jgi:hypothetical protein
MRLEDRRGIALAVALFALVVIAALVSGSFFAGRLEQQSGRNTIYGAQALEAAETGLGDVLTTIDVAAVQALTAGGAPLELGIVRLGTALSATRQITRLTTGVYLIRSTGTRTDADNGILATRTVALLVQLALAGESTPGGLVPLRERAWIQL